MSKKWLTALLGLFLIGAVALAGCAEPEQAEEEPLAEDPEDEPLAEEESEEGPLGEEDAENDQAVGEEAAEDDAGPDFEPDGVGIAE